MDENEEFEFRARAEQEARERAAATLAPPPRQFPVDQPDTGNPIEDMQAGIASTASRAVRGVGTTLLPKSAEAYLEGKGILPREADVNQLHEMAGRSGYGTAAEIGTDIALSALPIAKGSQLFSKIPGAGRFPTAAAYLGDIATNAGYNAVMSDNPSEAAVTGAAGGAISRPLTALAGKVLPHVLGTTTGAGDDVIRNEFQRGAAGLPTDMRSADPSARISQAYETARKGWSSGPPGLVNPKLIRQSYKDAIGELTEGNIWKTPSDQRAVLAIGDHIDNVLSDRANWTPKRMDAFKQSLNDMVNNLQTPQAKTVMGRVARQTRDLIDQSGLAPGYGKAMSEDAARRAVLSNGEHPLHSLLPKKDRFFPTHTSLTGVGLEGLATLALGPKALVMTPMISPRLVGEGARAAGQVARVAPDSAHTQLVNAILAMLRGNQSGE